MFLLFYAILEIINGNFILFGIFFTVFLLNLFSIFFLIRTQNNRFSEYFLVCTFSILMFYLIIEGGPWKVGYLWSLTFPAFSLVLLGLKRGSIASLFFLGLLMVIAGSRKWKEIIVVSIVSSLCIYVFFQKIFVVILPSGKIF